MDSLVLIALVASALACGALAVRFLRRVRRERLARTWRRVLVGNLLVLAALLSFLLLGGELYYRYIYDTTEAFGLSRTTARWFERHVRANNFGFRDSIDYAHARDPARRRISFIGDSFTVGHGIVDPEARFTNRVRRALPGVEVHQIAEAGWETGHELRMLARMTGDGYELDWVVLVYCLNDIADIVPEWRAIGDRIYLEDPGFVVRHSFLLDTLYNRWRASTDPDLADYFGFVRASYEGSVWERQRERLRDLRDLVTRARGRLAVVTFPFLQSLGADYPYRAVHARLDALWRDFGVAHLDLLPTLEAQGRAGLVVNRFDAHPNELANELVATALLPFLLEIMSR